MGFENSTSPLGRHLSFRTSYVSVDYFGHFRQLHLPSSALLTLMSHDVLD